MSTRPDPPQSTAKPPLILGVGEILWDLLPEGKQLGGAPANFAYHAHALGAWALPISRVGDDVLGRELLARLEALGLPTEGISLDPSAPTGTVSVELQAGGQPIYTIHENVAWDRLSSDEVLLSLASQADVLCFGSLAQRTTPSRSAIRNLLAAAPRALRIFDVNLRQSFYSKELIQDSLEIAHVLKLNETELPVLASYFDLKGPELDQLHGLAQRFSLDLVALTRGARGSLLLRGHQFSELEGIPVKVVDTVGAGDAFTAALAVGWLAGQGLEALHASASRLAAFVCTQPGATPELPEEFVRSLTSPRALVRP